MLFETQRLIIRPFRMSDISAFLAAYDGRLPSTSPFDVGKIEGVDLDFFQSYHANAIALAKNDSIYIFAAFEKDTGDLIGVVEFIVLLRSGFGWGSFGISLHNQFFRRGYGSELTAYAHFIAKKLGLIRLESVVEVDNLTSIKMLEKCGFTFECTRKKFVPTQDGYIDAKIYYKLLI